MAVEKAKITIASNPVVVYSISHCPYCITAENLLKEVKAKFLAIELDLESDGNETRAAIKQISGQSSVPNIFIGGKHVGGCDDITAMNKAGKLVPLLAKAGALAVTA